MSQISTSLEKTAQWDDICFPIKMMELSDILPEYQIIPTDRKMAIVGEQDGRKKIFAIQSEDYSLIPNTLIKNIIEDCFGDYTLDIRSNHLGEFTINIITASSISVGNETIYKNLILNNSYTGKAPFTVQGSVIKSHKEEMIKVSYYRKICSNGLMGWADEFMNYDQYINWLIAGKPKKFKDAKKQKTEVVTKEIKEEEELLRKSYSHRGLDVERFAKHLRDVLMEFSKASSSSITAQVYNSIVNVPASRELIKDVLTDIKLPKQLAKQAEERLEKEVRMLNQDPNLWLLYNSINFALFNSRSSLSLNDRYKLDESALHQVAAISI